MVKTQAWVQSLVGELTSQKVHGAAKKKTRLSLNKKRTNYSQRTIAPGTRVAVAYPQIHLGLGLVEGWGGGVPQ